MTQSKKTSLDKFEENCRGCEPCFSNSTQSKNVLRAYSLFKIEHKHLHPCRRDMWIDTYFMTIVLIAQFFTQYFTDR